MSMEWVDEIEAEVKAATRQGKRPTLDELNADMALYHKAKDHFARLIAAARSAQCTLHEVSSMAHGMSMHDEDGFDEIAQESDAALETLEKGEFTDDALRAGGDAS